MPLFSRPVSCRGEAAATETPAPGHNGGPPLDDIAVEPNEGDELVHFHWKRAHRAAWRGVCWDVMMFRLEKAEALDLTYEEYTLEILERGRRLQPTDTELIAGIKSRRGRALLTR